MIPHPCLCNDFCNEGYFNKDSTSYFQKYSFMQILDLRLTRQVVNLFQEPVDQKYLPQTKIKKPDFPRPTQHCMFYLQCIVNILVSTCAHM